MSVSSTGSGDSDSSQLPPIKQSDTIGTVFWVRPVKIREDETDAIQLQMLIQPSKTGTLPSKENLWHVLKCTTYSLAGIEVSDPIWLTNTCDILEKDMKHQLEWRFSEDDSSFKAPDGATGNPEWEELAKTCVQVRANYGMRYPWVGVQFPSTLSPTPQVIAVFSDKVMAGIDAIYRVSEGSNVPTSPRSVDLTSEDHATRFRTFMQDYLMGVEKTKSWPVSSKYTYARRTGYEKSIRDILLPLFDKHGLPTVFFDFYPRLPAYSAAISVLAPSEDDLSSLMDNSNPIFSVDPVMSS